MFETASFHMVTHCNMKCKFCYATFNDISVKYLPLEDVKIILFKLKEFGLKKITFAGGEPLMYKYIEDSIYYAKSIGLTTSIITNGSLLTEEHLIKFKDTLDWIGISVDSLNFITNKNIGRLGMDHYFYKEIIDKIKKYNYKLKINTVVNRYNEYENMQDFIEYCDPLRWKVFETLKVEGQNDLNFDLIKCSKEGFNHFISSHKHKSMVVEDNDVIIGSYLLIDALGRLFEDTQGKHTYSSPLQYNSIEKCLSEITLNRENFIKRGGIYNW